MIAEALDETMAAIEAPAGPLKEITMGLYPRHGTYLASGVLAPNLRTCGLGAKPSDQS
jgi:hypothetical protein